MKQMQLRQALDAMAQTPGVDGCALVEIETGMVWHHAGSIDDVQTFAEAASDYWRLHKRLSPQFEKLGDLRASIMVHTQGRLTMLPCGKGILLLALTRHQSTTDWAQWQKETRKLALLVEDL
ncbi:roadblock/LC7 domain-containing protein [Ottowia sp. VDI28]|uniref:roadblock/LC7 domain-containing protein n=1 Tax=Ottowia sp. VDI28 TaxID=3133968 RepID=UPI003C2C850B